MNLVALQLGMLLGRGQHDAAAAGIDLFGNLKALFRREAKDLHHHGGDVIVGMVVVVPENHVVPRLRLGLALLLFFPPPDRLLDGLDDLRSWFFRHGEILAAATNSRFARSPLYYTPPERASKIDPRE